jgi:RimJ/RimL family protein N-acetyltransferase
MELLEEKYIGGGLHHVCGESVKLRPLREEDLDLISEWIPHRELTHPISSLNSALKDKESDSRLLKLKEKNDLIIFVIEDSISSIALGTCQLMNIDWASRDSVLQVSFADDNSQNWDIGCEVVWLLCKFGFQDLNLQLIRVQVFSTSTRAIATFHKVGFRQVLRRGENAYMNGSLTGAVYLEIDAQTFSQANMDGFG